jgi:hypothetical protein
MAAVRQLTSGGYLVQVSETELALIKTALEQTQQVSRFAMELLDGADHDGHGRRVENTLLRREIEALAIREASLRSLHETVAEAERGGGCVAGQRPAAGEPSVRAGANDQRLPTSVSAGGCA